MLSVLNLGHALLTARFSGLWMGQPDLTIHEVCPAHDGQIQLNGLLVFLGQSFRLYQSPVTRQEVFFRVYNSMLLVEWHPARTLGTYFLILPRGLAPDSTQPSSPTTDTPNTCCRGLSCPGHIRS